MTITVNDLKFFKSERMTDFADGGGQMTGNEIVPGVENQIFDDISDVDRAAGDVSIRKIYAAVTSANTDNYLDAGVVVFDEPDDPNVSVLLTTTNDFYDERAAIQSYVENYRIQSNRYFAWLFELQIEGARTLTFFARESDEAPPINTSLCLIEYTSSAWATESHHQYVRVIRILLDEVQTFTDNSGSFERRIITVELSEALRYTFHGAEINRLDNLHPLAVVYSTMVVDAAKYYGIRPLVQQATTGDTVIYADSIMGRIIPSSQIESPVTDVTAVGERTFAVPASLTTISFQVADTFIPGFVLYAGRPIVPRTLVITVDGGELVDDGGNLKSGLTSVGEVDYAQGVITFSTLSPTYSGTKTVTFRPAAAISRCSNSFGIPITDQTRFRAYVASLKPIPDPGTVIVDYLSGGNWYRLRDDGNGALAGASSAYGGGTINFTTGSLSLTLGSYPDINSSILISYGSGADTRSITQAATPLVFKVATGRTGLVPGQQTLAWSGNTLTDQGDGTMTGTGGSAVISYGSGEIILNPTTIPASNTAMTFAGQQYAPASRYDESFTPTATDGVISIILAHQAIIPESVSAVYWVQLTDAVAPPTYPINTIATTATTVTLTLGSHTAKVGDTIQVQNVASPLNYLNGYHTVIGITATEATFAATNAGYSDPDLYSVTNVSTTAWTATLTIGTHVLESGDSITVSNITTPLTNLNGNHTIATVDGTSVTFAATNSGYNDPDLYSVTNISTTATAATLTIGTHVLESGDSITVSNVTAPLTNLNGNHTITGVTGTGVTFAATNAGYTGNQSTKYITYVSGDTVYDVITVSVDEHDFTVDDQVVITGFAAPYEFLNGTFLITGVTHDVLYDDTFTFHLTDAATFGYNPPDNTCTAQNIPHTQYYSGDYEGDIEHPVTKYYSGNYNGDVEHPITKYYSGDYNGEFSFDITLQSIATSVTATGLANSTWSRRARDNIALSFTAGGTINGSAGTFTLETDCLFSWHYEPVYEWIPQQVMVWDDATNTYVVQLIPVQVLVRYDLVADTEGTFKAGSTVYVSYAVANTPDSFSDALTLATGGLNFSLQPQSGEQIASGSVRLLIGDRVYHDVFNSMVYGFNPVTGAGTVAGTIDAASGQVVLTDWPSVANSYTIQARAVRIPSVPVSTVTFRTPTAPIAVGSFSFRVYRYQSAEVFEGSANEYGVISGNGVVGRFDYQTGVATLSFGSQQVAVEHTSKPWYATDFITTEGYIYAPNLVDLETLIYNCVTYVSMPLDSAVIGIDPVRLPGDGLIPIYRTGQMALVHHTASHSENSLSPTQQVDMGRERLYRVVIEDANALRFPATFYSVNRETGIVTMASDLNLTGYTAPYAFKHTIADLSVIMDTDLSGRLALTKAVSHTFPATTSRVSPLLYIGTLQARVTNVFEQATWTSEWLDEPVGDPPLAQYDDVNYPILVTNAGAYQDRFLIRFTSSTAFQVIGEQLGIIAEGTIAEDCAPVNPLTGGTMFTIDSAGWGIYWSTGYCLRFNIIGAAWPIDCIRAIQPSQPTGDLDQVEILLVGNINA